MPDEQGSKLIVPPFRMSFPSLFTPNSYQGSDPKFTVTAIWDKDDVQKGGKYHVTWKKLLLALNAKAQEFFNMPLAKLPANIRKGIRDGGEKSHLNGYGDSVLFASLSSSRKPQVIDLRKQIIPDGDTQRIYPGAWARATVNVFAYDNIGKGLALSLNNVQWLGHGERLDSVTDARDDFETDPEDEWFQAEAEATGVEEDPPTNAGATIDDDDDDIPF